MMIQTNIVVAFYKPYGVLSAFTDPEGRPTLKNYIPLPDIYPVGRLDFDSEGLLLLTNDGGLIHRLTHPQHHVPKTYLVQVEGVISPEAVAALQRGVVIKGRRTRRCQVVVIPEPSLPPRERPVTPHGPTSWLRIVLFEGMKRQIRHMTAAVGYPTLRIVRIAIGPINLEGLLPGQWRFLSPLEIEQLQEASRR
jgi:23S rRNA pseudouridine2457 synthase